LNEDLVHAFVGEIALVRKSDNEKVR